MLPWLGLKMAAALEALSPHFVSCAFPSRLIRNTIVVMISIHRIRNSQERDAFSPYINDLPSLSQRRGPKEGGVCFVLSL